MFHLESCTTVTEAEPASYDVLYRWCQSTPHTVEPLTCELEISQVSNQDLSIFISPSGHRWDDNMHSISWQLILCILQLCREHLADRRALCTWAFQKNITKVRKTWYLTHLSLSSESFTEQNRKQNKTVYYLGSHNRRGSPTAEFRKGLE